MAKLGFGIMRFQDLDGKVDYDEVGKAIDEYMKGEFCYFDLHPGYVLGLAQPILRDFVVRKYPRERYYVANKMPFYGIKKYDDYSRILEQELTNCMLEYFDYYLLHAITYDVYKMHVKYGGFDFLEKIKKAGITRKIGFSFHDSPELLDEILNSHPGVDFVQLQINYLDWNRPPVFSEKCYEVAKKHNKPIIVMEPLKGGGLINELNLEGQISQRESVRMCMGFVASLDNVDVILSGMTDKKQVIDNRLFVEDNKCMDFKDKRYELLKKAYLDKNPIQCTGCGYCKRECPMGIAIPEIISIINACQNVGRDDTTALGRHRIFYRGYVKSEANAGKCISCKKCEVHCPQKLEIHKIMRNAKELLEMKMGGYTVERNVQMLIYILKENGIRKVVASPGTTNICFVYSVQNDDFFEVYSSADERSAAYIACGMAAESGEPVVLSCTGATASRNYLPGLTEAYYRNLPVLAVTSTQPRERYGNNFPQFVDRSVQPKDTVKASFYIPSIHTQEESWSANVNINRAILELLRENPKPIHINLETEYHTDYSVRMIPATRVIKRIKGTENFPEIKKGVKIGIYICAHKKMNEDLVKDIDVFCEKYNSVVIQDHTGNYTGKYGILAPLIAFQENKNENLVYFDVMIHLGDVSGAYMSAGAKEVWRIDPDGNVCDSFRTLSTVFEISEEGFFSYYSSVKKGTTEMTEFYKRRKKYDSLYSRIPELPFSNIWAAKELCPLLPENSVLHLAILHSLRSFNFFETDSSILAYSNTGGFGIDGCMSSLIGASMTDVSKLYFGIIGDLSFFYDMNSLGNRHISNNLRIMLVSNGLGTEFKNYSHIAYRFGDNTDSFIAAAGHYGNKSRELVKNYAEALGFRYISAEDKDEFNKNLPIFIDPQITEPILFELFTNHEEESESLKLIRRIDGQANQIVSQKTIRRQPKHIKDKYANVVLWGTGNCFRKMIPDVERIVKVRFVCDNDESKWGKEVINGLMCIPPDELSKMEDVFVVIMMEKADAIMQVANQLLDIGIEHFDSVVNWIEYAR